MVGITQMRSAALMNPNAAEEARIMRMRELSRALQESAMRDEGTQMVSGFAVPQSGLAALAKVLQGVTGAGLGGFAEYQDKKLADAMQKRRTTAAESGDVKQMLASGDPFLQEFALRQAGGQDSPRYGKAPTFVRTQDGRTIPILTDSAGNVKELSQYEQPPQPLMQLDTGDNIALLPRGSTEPAAVVPKGMTPDQRTDNDMARRRQTLEEAQARQEAAYKEYLRREKELDINKKEQELSNPAPEKPLPLPPANVVNAYRENALALSQIDKATSEIEKTPSAVGASKILPDMITQRWDPKGVDARALIADIGSLKIHDRSGAAVSASEAPRLKPFIPSVTDDAETVKKKLKQFRAQYEEIQKDLQTIYSPQNGFNLPSLDGTAEPPKVDMSPETIEQLRKMPQTPETKEVLDAVDKQSAPKKGGIRFVGWKK